ncbi:GPO family capsid scaffolding protein [Rivihabitans pingtungensis]|nr:GPO family capsid scaffolding protein [Rivihabitans pingtungensis]
MPKQSKPFVVATEGMTIDGRAITRQQIEQMAKNYNPELYTGVCNLEHYLSLMPDSTFSSQGRVVSLSTETKNLFGADRLQLLAVVEVDEGVAALQDKWKKAFSSIEMVPNFLGSGQAYLTGLAFTDSPASIGTERIKFSSNAQGAECYSSAQQISVDFGAATPPANDPPGAEKTMMAALSEMLARVFGAGQQPSQQPQQPQQPQQHEFATIEQVKKLFGASAEQSAHLAGQVEKLTATVAATSASLAELTQKLSTQPSGAGIPPATGGQQYQQTDC